MNRATVIAGVGWRQRERLAGIQKEKNIRKGRTKEPRHPGRRARSVGVELPSYGSRGAGTALIGFGSWTAQAYCDVCSDIRSSRPGSGRGRKEWVRGWSCIRRCVVVVLGAECGEAALARCWLRYERLPARVPGTRGVALQGFWRGNKTGAKGVLVFRGPKDSSRLPGSGLGCGVQLLVQLITCQSRKRNARDRKQASR
jgi:hypothetical protein